MIEVQADQKSLDSIISMMGSTQKQVDMARASALRKMRRRIETEVKRQAAKELRMPQKALGGRLYSEPVKTSDESTRVWFGTQPVSPFALGTVGVYGAPGRAFSGVMVGTRKYVGAFLATIYTSRSKVWIRLRSQFFSPELYPTKKRPGDRGLGDDGLRGRFPVVRAAVPVDEVIEKVVNNSASLFADDFVRIFTQELNYFTNVHGK
jgi:hypothetical protein